MQPEREAVGYFKYRDTPLKHFDLFAPLTGNPERTLSLFYLKKSEFVAYEVT